MGFRIALVILATVVVSCQRGVIPQKEPPRITDMSTLTFSYKPEEIDSLCRSEMERLKSDLNTIGARPKTTVTFANTVQALESALTTFSNNTGPAIFTKYVSTDSAVREMADRCETEVQKFIVDIFVREDLYAAVKRAKEITGSLTMADSLLLDEFVTKFRQNGLELDPEQRKVFVEKKKKLVELEAEFSKALVEWKDQLEVTEAETEGLPEAFKKGLKKTIDGKYIIGMAYPSYFPFMENAKNAEARKKLEFKFNNRGGDANRERLEQAVRLRHELATMLGYETHAELVLERRMAKKPEAVQSFISRLSEKLKVIGVQNLKEMLELKKEEDPAATQIHAWDWRYYDNQLKKRKYQVDSQLIKEYFPLDVVVQGMFEIYQQLLGVTYVRDTKGPVWHESVQLYQVKDGENTLAYFYMDLFPREGKYNHAAAFTLLGGYQRADGSYFAPISSIVANFTPPAEGKPALLEHSEVETLFHEFGHIMHQVLTRARYGYLSGTSVKTDFVEAPSQMLENWVWDKAMLKKLSGHYTDTSKKLPDDLIDRLVGAKLANSGLRYLRQVSFATIDMKYHTSASVDSTEIYRQVMKDIMMLPIQDGTKPQASFGHLMGGYDSGYYGYLWSEVYAQDMFTRFEKEGLLSNRAGLDYRRWILEPGGEKDPFELIKGFLGREPNEEAFLKSIGLGETMNVTPARSNRGRKK